jgi:hypothetical protein
VTPGDPVPRPENRARLALTPMRTALPLLVLAAAAGCYRSPGAPLEGTAPPTAPAGPAPRLAWIDNGFDASRLPAASAAGDAVLLGIHDADGARGNPNYRFEVRDRRDAVLDRHVVLAAEEADAMFDAGGKTAALDERISAANRWLAEQHGRLRLAPLQRLEVEPGEEIASSFRATGGGVTLEWRPSRLTIAQAGQQLVDRVTPAAWIPADRPMAGGTETCHNPAFLGGAAVDVARKLVVLTIQYGGTDLCWEPDAAHHVVAW